MHLYLKFSIKFNFSSNNSSIIAVVYGAEIKSYISFLKSDSLYKWLEHVIKYDLIKIYSNYKTFLFMTYLVR